MLPSQRSWNRKILVFSAFSCLMSAPGSAQGPTPADRVAALFESSFAYEAKGNSSKALADTQEILQLQPSHYVANLRAGWLAYATQRYEESLNHYNRAAELAPRAVEPQLGVLLPLMALKRWPQAETIAKGILAVVPRNYLASSRLAFTEFSLAHYRQAEGLYAQVLSDYPGDLEMMLGLGWTQVRLGKKDDARAGFTQVLGISRQNASAKAGLEACK